MKPLIGVARSPGSTSDKILSAASCTVLFDSATRASERGLLVSLQAADLRATRL